MIDFMCLLFAVLYSSSYIACLGFIKKEQMRCEIEGVEYLQGWLDVYIKIPLELFADHIKAVAAYIVIGVMCLFSNDLCNNLIKEETEKE